jgi:8-oxo-dGTP pyrophosphatase MutT (NUDIX family)
MAELWDIYDASGAKTGDLISRDEPLKEGQYHLVVHIWIKNAEGKWLIQKRADHVEWAPGFWAATGGSAISGEDSLTAAIRETKEELGLDIDASQMKFISRIIRNTAFTDIWLAESNVQPNDLVLEHAVSDVRYVTVKELNEMIKAGEFINYLAHEMYTEEIMKQLFNTY